MRLGAGLIAAFWTSATLAQDALPALSLRDAIERALAQNVNVLVARTQVEASRGAAQQALGQFDPAVTAQGGGTRTVRPLRESERQQVLPFGFDLRNQLTDSYQLQGGINQQFQNGVQAGVTLTHTHTWDNLLSLQGEPRQNIGAIQFQLRLPILKNSGGIVSAPLRASESEIDATRKELEFSAAQTILNTALAYWDYRARLERFDIASASERRAADLVEELRKLIAADELPAAELNLARASLSERRSTRFASEQAVLEARRVLGRQLGLHGREALAIGAPSDNLPAYDGRRIDAVARARVVAERALESRGDIAGLRDREQAATIRAEAALANTRPQVDVVLGATQAGLAEGTAPFNVGASLSRNWFGPGYSAQVVYSYPLGNNAALGIAAQARAQLDGTRVRLRELGSSITASIETAAYAVQSAAVQLDEANAAVNTYAVSVENERTKRRLGSATLIDVLNVEDRYNNALIAAVQARQNWANALGQFGFEANVLLARDGEQYRARLAPLFDHAAR